jgi:hypothetical protein
MPSQLCQELYPALLESSGGLGVVHTKRNFQHCAELMDILRIRRELKMVLFGIDSCSQCGNRCVYNLEGFLRCYWKAAQLAANVKSFPLSSGK